MWGSPVQASGTKLISPGGVWGGAKQELGCCPAFQGGHRAQGPRPESLLTAAHGCYLGQVGLSPLICFLFCEMNVSGECKD